MTESVNRVERRWHCFASPSRNGVHADGPELHDGSLGDEILMPKVVSPTAAVPSIVEAMPPAFDQSTPGEAS